MAQFADLWLFPRLMERPPSHFNSIPIQGALNTPEFIAPNTILDSRSCLPPSPGFFLAEVKLSILWRILILYSEQTSKPISSYHGSTVVKEHSLNEPNVNLVTILTQL